MVISVFVLYAPPEDPYPARRVTMDPTRRKYSEVL